MSCGDQRLLVVGKGPPDTGGIATFLRTVLATEAAARRDGRLLNVANTEALEGGRLSRGNLRRTVLDARAVWRASKDRDVVHVHSALAPGVTLLRAGLLSAAARLRGCGVVVHAHGGRIQLWATTRRRRLLVRLALLSVGQVVAVCTDGHATLVDALGEQRVTLLANAVDVDAFGPRGPRHDPPRIVFVGLLTARKGVLDLAAASRLLTERQVPHELWLVGGTPDEGLAAEQEVRAALPPEVRLLGQLPPDEVAAAYREADVFCLPSWWEAMPLSVLEAMATGLPVVATSVGDVPRIVRDGATGLVVPPRDPRALADALERVLRSPDGGAALGSAGRRYAVREHSLQALSTALDEVYRSAGRTRLKEVPA